MGKRITNTICHCTRLHRSEENVTNFYDNHLKPAGVTARQYSMLRQIQLHPECSVKELSDITEQDRSTLTRSLKALFKSGYVEDLKKPGTRNSRLCLTDKGEVVCGQARSLWEKTQKEFEEIVGIDNVIELERILMKLQNL